MVLLTYFSFRICCFVLFLFFFSPTLGFSHCSDKKNEIKANNSMVLYLSLFFMSSLCVLTDMTDIYTADEQRVFEQSHYMHARFC